MNSKLPFLQHTLANLRKDKRAHFRYGGIPHPSWLKEATVSANRPRPAHYGCEKAKIDKNFPAHFLEHKLAHTM